MLERGNRAFRAPLVVVSAVSARYSPAMKPTPASTRIAAAIHRRYGETVDVAEDLRDATRWPS